MTARNIFIFLFIAFNSFFNQAFTQSLGIIYEASSFSLQDFYYSEYSNPTGLIKNLFLNYNAPLNESFILSFRAGYGWNRYEYSYYDGKEIHETNTDGIPLETEIKYLHKIGKDSLFEPILGIGLGYYYYNSINKSSSSSFEHKFISRGLAQYLTFGLNINVTENISSSIQFKKNMANWISTKYTEGNDIMEKDYAQGNGLDDLSISLGIFFKVY
ncbi:MAG TPA: hypothetical protein VMT35_17435 [Ignavibacteriaceae bacterium]|nr:hypothetical protein [Ignavibacteriaceae bacterium]